MAPQSLRAGAVGGDPLGVGDLVAAELEELRLGDVLERDVEPVDPRHRLRGRIVVGVPVPACLRQEVAAPHRHRIPDASGPVPPTTVQTPSPSTTKRNACWVCRCSGASSPGLRYWMAAHRVGVANGRPPRPGFARAMARRSPPRPTGTRRPACAAMRQQVGPPPQMWLGSRLGVGRHEVADLGPQRHEVPGLEVAVERVQLRGPFRLVRRVGCGDEDGTGGCGHLRALS